MVHPDDQDKVAKALQNMLSTGLTDIKYHIVQPDGSIRWLHEVANNTSPDDPEILLGTLHAITGHKALEEKLRNQAITDDLRGIFNRRFFMKRLRQALAAMVFTTDAGTTFGVSITCGVASFSEEDLTEESILHRAGKSLYR